MATIPIHWSEATTATSAAEETSVKILIIDTYYPEAIHHFPFDANSTYEVELQKVLEQRFGTFDAYSRNLRALGWDAVDVIANHGPLQRLWSEQERSHGWRYDPNILDTQIFHYRPDVVFMQDLNISLAGNRFNPPLLAGQLSCPWPGDDIVKHYQILFSSFPHYIPRIEALGVRAVYLPLAFDPIVLDGPQPERDIDISFVGGVGRDSHWRTGTDTLEIIAERFQERFHWYGYGLENLPASSALRDCYRGEAWGRKQYDVYRRSKIVVNRHGEVAEGVANNLRMYEATGCGAMLVTDNATNEFELGDLCQYSCASDAVKILQFFIENDGVRKVTAERGQRRTLNEHTYASRMNIVSEALTEMLCRV